jgi:hypothetical protein
MQWGWCVCSVTSEVRMQCAVCSVQHRFFCELGRSQPKRSPYLAPLIVCLLPAEWLSPSDLFSALSA